MQIDHNSQFLFKKRPLRGFTENNIAVFRDRVENMDPNRLSAFSTEELLDELIESLSYPGPTLIEDSIHRDEPEEAYPFESVSVSSQRHLKVPGVLFRFYVPFEGDAGFFYLTPNSGTSSPPRAFVKDDSLVFAYWLSNEELETLSIEEQLDKDIAEVKRYLEWVAADLNRAEVELRDLGQGLIEARKNNLEKKEKYTAKLNIPLRRPKNQRPSIPPPNLRRKRPIKTAAKPKASQTPSFDLPSKDYEFILESIRLMGTAITRSPSVYGRMEEEHMRDIILVFLNGQYELNATGETFSHKGKSDIFVQTADQKTFIAECKIWGGPKAFSEAIDQLSGYVTWQDTKSALVIFNRTKSLTKVIKAADEQCSKHALFRKKLDSSAENERRYLFCHPRDDQRKLYLAVLAIDVPTTN